MLLQYDELTIDRVSHALFHTKIKSLWPKLYSLNAQILEQISIVVSPCQMCSIQSQFFVTLCPVLVLSYAGDA
mgnify:CR=1